MLKVKKCGKTLIFDEIWLESFRWISFLQLLCKNEIPLSFFISQSFYSSEWKYKIIFACQVAILIDSKFDLDSPLFQFQRKTKSLSKHLWQFVPVTSMDCIFFCGQIDLGNLLIF